ncbi:MAG: DUF63 family protein [Halobacteria archaeon]
MGFQEWLYETYAAQLVCDAKRMPPGCEPNFNPVDTATYALVLGIALYGVFKLLRRWNVKVDSGFILATAPYVVVGIGLRVVEDTDILMWTDAAYLLITPVIFFPVFGITVASLWLSLRLQKAGKVKDYRRLYGSNGLALGLFCIGWVALSAPQRQPPPESHLWVLPFVMGVSLIAGLLFTAAGRKIPKASFLAPWTSGAILGAHTIDAASSFAGITYLGYRPLHVLETFLINATGTAASIFAMKWAVLVPVLHLVKKSFKPEEEGMKNLVLLAILILGLGPGLRNTLRMTFGV